jgi:Tfp pilus assembly protein PilN
MSAARRSWTLPRLRRRGPAEVNLARRPFVNERPVRRAAMLLLAAGLALAAVNGWLYTRYVVQRGANEGELNRLEAEIESEERRATALARQLAAADLTQQNDLVVFLNQRIAERTFGWSVLFDRLEDLLPRDVRLVSLAPAEVVPPRASAGAAPVAVAAETRFNLAISGVARQPEAVLELIDALFADAAFRDPDLHQETFRTGEVQFTLDVIYLPRVAEALADGGAATAEADGSGRVFGAGRVLTPGATASDDDEEPR